MSSGFISEKDVEEHRRIRQENWAQSRGEEDPLEAPEPPVDHRSLYDRLQEQRQKKQDEYDEAHKYVKLFFYIFWSIMYNEICKKFVFLFLFVAYSNLFFLKVTSYPVQLELLSFANKIKLCCNAIMVMCYGR